MTPLGIETATFHTNKGLKVFEQTTVPVSHCPPPPVPHGPTRNRVHELSNHGPREIQSVPRSKHSVSFFFTFMWPCCIVTNFFVTKLTRCTNFTNLFWHETLRVSDSSSVHHQEFILCTLSNCICHTAFEQDQPWSCSKAVYKPVWHIALLSVQWINSWWWTEELSETCRVSGQNKFVKLVHLVGFIIKKFVTIHGHMNVKKKDYCGLQQLLAEFSPFYRRIGMAACLTARM
jgi:hypothetical protein